MLFTIVLVAINALTGGMPITCLLLIVSMSSFYFWRDVMKCDCARKRAVQTGLIIMGIWCAIIYVKYVHGVPMKLDGASTRPG